MRRLFLFSILFISSFCIAQDTDLTAPIEVYFDQYENAVTDYIMEEGKTLYNASKIYNVAIPTILKFNNIKSANDIPKGTNIIIPIDFAYTFRGASISGYKTTKFIPLVYTIKPKDNLYRIAKVYCGESVKDMMQRNGLKSKDLNIGQKLILGWIPLDSKSIQHYSKVNKEEQTPELVGPTQEFTSDSDIIPYQDKMVATQDSTLEEEIDLTLKKEKGIAIWSKSSKGHSKYALHPTALINSEIELYNPIVNRKVMAKVIGRIPEGAYNSDVSVIISPATAVSLGALDNRFKVEMTYKQ